MYPQAVFFPIRTLFLTLKIEQRERFKQSEAAEKQQAGSFILFILYLGTLSY